MKITIVTFHKPHNFGAMLQAVALRTQLEDMGHEVNYLDYWPKEYEKAHYGVWFWDKILRMPLLTAIKHCIILTLMLPLRVQRRLKFNRFYSKFIKPYAKSGKLESDLAVYGSDQIWGQIFGKPQYDPIYFGVNEIAANRHISYAASMGSVKITENDRQFLISHLGNFSTILVREAELEREVTKLGFPCSTVCDPTLLLDRQKWAHFENPKRIAKEPYLLYYKLGGEFNLDNLRKFAAEHGLKVKIISGGIRWDIKKGLPKDEDLNAVGPAEFISLIRDAEYVFTTSFHGLVFSILYQKQFVGNYKVGKTRAESLVNILGLESRIIDSVEDFTELLATPIDYNKVNGLLSDFRAKSISHLEHALA